MTCDDCAGTGTHSAIWMQHAGRRSGYVLRDVPCSRCGGTGERPARDAAASPLVRAARGQEPRGIGDGGYV